MSVPRVIYSVASSFGGDGLGVISENTLREAFRAGAVARIFNSCAAPTELDPVVRDFLPRPLAYLEDRAAKRLYRYGLFRPVHLAHATFFDHVVARRLGIGDLFFGWQGYARASLGAAAARGMPTVLECCNSHVDNVQEVLSRERARFGLPASELDRWVRRLRSEYERADFLCCPSQYVADSLVARGVPPEKVFLVPYGVDAERYVPAAEPRVDHTFRAVFVGDDMLRKGAHVVLAAWRRAGLANAELVLCGAVYPQHRRILEPLADDNVVFAGHTRDVRPRLHAADVFVLPTFEDGFGLAILEAMASGLPAITTTNGCGPDVIEDGADGYVLGLGDVEALAERLRHLHADRDAARQMGQRARRKAEHFSWQRRSRGVLAALEAIGRGTKPQSDERSEPPR